MKTLVLALLVIVGLDQVHAGGGSYGGYCTEQTVLRCQTTDGRTLVDLVRLECEDPDYPGTYNGGNKIVVNHPGGRVDGYIKYVSDPLAWKISSQASALEYKLGDKYYDIEMTVASNYRGTALIKEVGQNTAIVAGEVICR